MLGSHRIASSASSGMQATDISLPGFESCESSDEGWGEVLCCNVIRVEVSCFVVILFELGLGRAWG